MSGFPCPSLVREALSSLEFLAVSDLLPTETTRLATVVLPSASFAEKEGTFTNLEGRVQPVRKAVEPFGESRADWQIILDLAAGLGHPMPYSSPRQVMDEIKALTALPLMTPHQTQRFSPAAYPLPASTWKAVSNSACRRTTQRGKLPR